MRYKALVGFSGKVSASKGSELEITNRKIAKDLLAVGYIELAEDPDKGKTGKKAKAEPVAEAPEEETPTEAEVEAEKEK